ncbi:MAG: hypothetical protein ACRC46_00240 [Thermoguttaceae bacterium]
MSQTLSPPQEEATVPAPKRKRRRLRNRPRTLGQLLELRIMQVAHRIRQADIRIEQVERQMAEIRQEMREQFARVDTRIDSSANRVIGLLSIVIAVALSITGWMLSDNRTSWRQDDVPRNRMESPQRLEQRDVPALPQPVQ